MRRSIWNFNTPGPVFELLKVGLLKLFPTRRNALP